MKQINFETFSLLIKLDLSFNQLTRIDSEHFLTLNSLEFLNLSNNKIDFFDDIIFTLKDNDGKIILSNLKYLNLENCQLKFVANRN